LELQTLGLKEESPATWYETSPFRSSVTTDMNSKTIEADCRENAAELLQVLKNRYGFEIEVKQLKIGDYLIHPDTLVERKTTRDFAVSILDGRLFNQAYKLAEQTEYPIIIIEGESFADAGLPIHNIKGALISLAQTFRIPFLRTKNHEDTAWHFNQLHLQRDRIGSNRGVRRSYKPKRIENQKKAVLKTLPGIGEKIAHALLEKFGSVSDVVSARKEELLAVPGIGPKTLARINSVLKDEHDLYSV